MFLLVFTTGFLGGLAICAGVNAWKRPAPAAPADPCAESRARASALRADCDQLPGGTSRG